MPNAVAHMTGNGSVSTTRQEGNDRADLGLDCAGRCSRRPCLCGAHRVSEEVGPGAGRTSDPTTSVVTERIAALDRHLTAEITGLHRHVSSEVHRLEEALSAEVELRRARREDDLLAVRTALASQKELSEKHNDLIRQMERKDALYATNTEVDRLAAWQARLGGGLLVLGFIGVANLIKVWSG
jgi:hypothetical protein